MPETPIVAITPGVAFGLLLRGARESRRLTQDQVAELSKVSRRTLTRFEGGQTVTPYPEHVRAVCQVLDIPVTAALITLGYLDESDLARVA